MKFKIKNNKEEEPVIELWLEENGEGAVLEGRDNKGKVMHLMLFRGGKFYRNADAELEGLQTDSDGRILEE